MASCFRPEVSPPELGRGKKKCGIKTIIQQKRDVEKTQVCLNMEHARFE
jgi:hypothetical protein